MGTIVINSFNEFNKYLGQNIGSSEYLAISQDRINKFADATLDHQWIHTDPERAAKSQFGGTIAHGYLTLSILPHLWGQIAEIRNIKMMVNYGIESLKFAEPVLVNDEVRLHATLESLTDLRGITKCVLGVKLEVKGKKKPALKANLVFLYHFIS
ncbi:MAG: MaoC family dehydratase [Cyclobacteriaceae bacterium]|nr:MaoC family dehydratase [Cyclobacteriaceae bacterium]